MTTIIPVHLWRHHPGILHRWRRPISLSRPPQSRRLCVLGGDSHLWHGRFLLATRDKGRDLHPEDLHEVHAGSGPGDPEEHSRSQLSLVRGPSVYDRQAVPQEGSVQNGKFREEIIKSNATPLLQLTCCALLQLSLISIFILIQLFLHHSLSQIHFHLPNSDTLYDHVTRDVLPSDIGGNGGTFAEIKQEWMRRIKNHRWVDRIFIYFFRCLQISW